MLEIRDSDGGDRPFLVDGRWCRNGTLTELRSPWDGRRVARYWKGGEEDLEEGLEAASRAFPATRRMSPHDRSRVLLDMVRQIRERREELARYLVQEAGKPITLARDEVDRAGKTFAWASEEARRIGGELIPIDADPAGEGKIGILRRFPIGVVGAITPFNFPLNLVAHKVAPCLAAGNSIVLKPASQTPLSALAIGEMAQEAGYPAGGLNVIPCEGSVASRLARDPRVRLLTFTGSSDVGWELEAAARRKRVLLELGGNAAVVVHKDADLDRAAGRCVAGGFHYAGQSCISVQRIYVQEEIYASFRDQLLRRVSQLGVGDPAREEVRVGPMVTRADAERAETWVREAVEGGARVLVGGDRKGSLVMPTVLEGVDPGMKVSCQEVFAPIVLLQRYRDLPEAVRGVNDSPFGLQAGLFTRDLGAIQYAYREIEVGGLMVNEVPTFRVDHMPYGGVKGSGAGREGPRYAIEEMTEPRLLVLHGVDPA